MQENKNHLEDQIRLWQEKLFSRSIRRRRKLERLTKLVGVCTNLNCLEITSGDGLISSALRQLGGSWKAMAVREEDADSLACFVNDKVQLINNGKLPFDDNTFDQLVITDALKSITEDHEFIHECHRVLKNDAWVIISEVRRAPFSLRALLQRLLNVSPVALGARRNGYTEVELFNTLRDGFDVPETITYSNGLLEAASTLGEFFMRVSSRDHYWMVPRKVPQDEVHRYQRLYALAGFAWPIMWLLARLDFLPGHRLLVKSRRRRWRPRMQPKLIDGRSIAEAAINTKIGTAAPF